MKRSIVLIAVVLFFVGYDFARGQDIDIKQKEQQKQKQIAEGGEGGSATAQGGTVNFEGKAQPPQPVLPFPGPHAPLYPDKHCWKDMVYEPNELEAQEWTLEWAEAILGRVKNDWLKKEFIVKYLPTNSKYYPRTKSVQFRCGWVWNDRRLLSDYEYLDIITVVANVSWVDSRDVLAKIVKTATKEVGADLLTFSKNNSGLQAHVLAESGGFPLFFSIVGSSIAGTGGAGFSSSDITNDRRPFMTVRAYRHRRDKDFSSLSPLSGNTSEPVVQHVGVRYGSTRREIPIHHISEPPPRQMLPQQPPPQFQDNLSQQMEELTSALKSLRETIEESKEKSK